MFFWEFPRRLKHKSRRFGTQCRFHRPGRSGIKLIDSPSAQANRATQIAYPPHWLARLSPILYITLLLLHLLFLIAQNDGTDIEFRNVGFYTSDAGEIPKRT